jgi:hypothetical protein
MPNESENPNPAPSPTRTEQREKLGKAYEAGKAGWQSPRLDPPGGPPPPPRPTPIPQD